MSNRAAKLETNNGKPKAGSPSIGDRSNIDVVVLATYVAGGALRKIDTEDIAIKCHEIAPGRFSWRKYPQQINIELIRIRLSGAKKEGLLSGSQSGGWMLTAKGAEYVERELHGLARGASSRTSISSADRSWAAGERKRLLSTSAFKKYGAGKEDAITAIDVGEFFRIDAYIDGEVRQRKIDRILNAFRNDEKLGPAVQFLVNKLGGSR